MEPHPTPLMPYRKQETGWTRRRLAAHGLCVVRSGVLGTGTLDDSPAQSVGSHGRVSGPTGPGSSEPRVFGDGGPARRPWELLSICARLAIRAVFHQPLSRGSPRRHLLDPGSCRRPGHRLARSPVRSPIWPSPKTRGSNSERGPWQLRRETERTDRNRPGYSGIELLRRMRTIRPRGLALPVLPGTDPTPAGRRAGLCRPQLLGTTLGAGRLPLVWLALTRLDDGSEPEGDPTFALERYPMPSGNPFQNLNAAMSASQRKFASMQEISSDAVGP